jgi:hypothetical protein
MWLIRSPDFGDSFVAGRRFFETIAADGRMPGVRLGKYFPSCHFYIQSSVLYIRIFPGVQTAGDALISSWGRSTRQATKESPCGSDDRRWGRNEEPTLWSFTIFFNQNNIFIDEGDGGGLLLSAWACIRSPSPSMPARVLAPSAAMR